MEKDNKRKCSVCEIPHFERNNYFYGKLMTARDFTNEQCYFNEKRWLINRMIHGWGVVCGLDVHFEDSDQEECIQEISSCQKEKQCNIVIEPGLAIDCCGREILVCEKQIITLADAEAPCNSKRDNDKQDVNKYLICLEYNECKTEAAASAPSMCGQSEKKDYNRIRDFFKIRLRHESDVKIQDYQREFCQLFDRYSPGQGRSNKEYDDVDEPDCEQYETLHRYLCEKLLKGCPDCIPGGCLLLAEITVTFFRGEADDHSQEGKQKEQQEKPLISKINIRIDPCSRRRLVYNNKMLFDLIHCYHDDLPHIIDISWKDYHAEEGVYWDDFTKDVIEKGLIVTFDRKMDAATINRHTFLFSMTVIEKPSGTIDKKFVPAEIIEPLYDNECKYIFKAEKSWVDDEIDTKHSEFFEGTDVEITMRSSLILDKHGKALDGDFIGGKFPTGNGVQGGDFISWFSVRPLSDAKPSEQSKVQGKTFEDF